MALLGEKAELMRHHSFTRSVPEKIFFAPQAGAAKSHAWTSFSPVARIGPENDLGLNLSVWGPLGRYAPIPSRIRKTLQMLVFATWSLWPQQTKTKPLPFTPDETQAKS